MFLIGKLFLLFLKPLTWIIVIFVAGLVTRNQRKKKSRLLTALIALIICSNPFLFRVVAGAWEKPELKLAPGRQFSAGILLGGFVAYNVREHRASFNPASDRFIQTALLYKNGHIGKIIIAAGNGYVTEHHFHEADYAKQKLEALGIPGEVIFTDPYSRNTHENAVNSKQIADSLHLQGPLLLISSALHLRRAESLFVKQGMNVVSYPCDFVTQNVANNFWEDYLIPSSITLYYWDNLIKEMMGLLIYKIRGRA